MGRGLCPKFPHIRSQRPELRGNVGSQSGYPRPGVTAGGNQSSWLILPRMLNFYKPEILRSTYKPRHVSGSPSVTHVRGTTSQNGACVHFHHCPPKLLPFCGPSPLSASCASCQDHSVAHVCLLTLTCAPVCGNVCR